MKKFYRFKWLAMLTCMISLSVTLQSIGSAQSASDAPPVSESELREREMAALARALNATPKSVADAWNDKPTIQILQVHLDRHFANEYSGLWVTYSPIFQVHVGVKELSGKKSFGTDLTNLIKAADQKLTQPIRIVQFRHSSAELIAAQKAAEKGLSALNVRYMAGIDVIQNVVEIRSTAYVKSADLLRSAGLKHLEAAIKIVHIGEQDLPRPATDLYAGMSIWQGGAWGCTTGFTVLSISNPNIAGITTAAHCLNDAWVNGVSLSFNGSSQGGSDDSQWHTGSATFRNWAYDGSVNRTISSQKSHAALYVGEGLCRYGRVSGYACGSVLTTNYTFPGADNLTYVNFARTNLTVQPGDSGGPVMSGGMAYGLSSHSGPGEMYYWPIDRLGNLGLSLKTN